MKKFFDSRRELVSSGPGSIPGGGGAGSGSGGSFIGRVFTIGRYQVTVEEIIAEGDLCDSLLCRSTVVTQPPLTRSTCRAVYPIVMRMISVKQTSGPVLLGCGPASTN